MAQSQTVQGKIARVSEKPGFTDRETGEPVSLYSFQLEGSSQWYRTGQSPIPAGVGQSVKFVANGANVERNTMQATQAAVAPAPVAATTTATTSSIAPPASRAKFTTGSKDDYWANKEARDLEKDARFQAVNEPRMALSVAVQAAASIVSTALTSGAISFGNAAKAKKLGLLSAYTKEVALDLASFISDAPAQLAGFKPHAVSSVGEPETDGEVQE